MRRVGIGEVTIMRKAAIATIIAGVLTFGSVSAAVAAPLPEGCTKDQGTVTCTSFEGPGNNQGGVGETEETTTQGNTSNFSPEPQGTGQTSSCNPPSSQGAPCNQ
jgi:hypothetical protein